MIGRTFHGDKLREIRQRTGILQTRFAEEVRRTGAGCHYGHLTRIESGRTQYVSVELAYAFINTLNRLGATIDGRPVTLDDLSSVDPAGCACSCHEAQPA